MTFALVSTPVSLGLHPSSVAYRAHWAPSLFPLTVFLKELAIDLGHSYHCAVLSRVWLFGTPWTAARQPPRSMGFSRQEYWSELPCRPPGHLPNPGIKPGSPTLHADSLCLSHQGSPQLSPGGRKRRKISLKDTLLFRKTKTKLSKKHMCMHAHTHTHTHTMYFNISFNKVLTKLEKCCY